MIIVFFPLVPVIIGILLVGLSLANELQGMINIITTVAMVILVIIAIIIFIVNLISAKNGYLDGKKLLMNTVAGIAAIIGSYIFFSGLNGIKDLISFVLELIIGGSIWFLMVGHWWGTCAEEDGEAVKCFLITLGVAIGMIII